MSEQLHLTTDPVIHIVIKANLNSMVSNGGASSKLIAKSNPKLGIIQSEVHASATAIIRHPEVLKYLQYYKPAQYGSAKNHNFLKIFTEVSITYYLKNGDDSSKH